MSNKVYCQGCVHLLLLKSRAVLPLCVATARFKGGTLRKNIDVVGVVHAEDRNARNNCKHKSVLVGYFKSRKMKDWLRRDIHAEEAKLEEYDERIEIQKAKRRRIKKSNVESQIAEEAARELEDSEASSSEEVRDFDSDHADDLPDAEGADGSAGDEDEGSSHRQALADRGDDERASDDAGGGGRSDNGEDDSDLSGEDGVDLEIGRRDPKVKASSEAWERAYLDKFEIIDADGWDKADFHTAWFEEKITEMEFLRRTLLSTCTWKVKGKAELDKIFKGISL